MGSGRESTPSTWPQVWERVFSPYGAYRKHFASELEPTFSDDELVRIEEILTRVRLE